MVLLESFSIVLCCTTIIAVLIAGKIDRLLVERKAYVPTFQHRHRHLSLETMLTQSSRKGNKIAADPSLAQPAAVTTGPLLNGGLAN